MFNVLLFFSGINLYEIYSHKAITKNNNIIENIVLWPITMSTGIYIARYTIIDIIILTNVERNIFGICFFIFHKY